MHHKALTAACLALAGLSSGLCAQGDSLDGLWGLCVSGDVSMRNTHDIAEYAAKDSAGLPDTYTYLDYSLRLRHHVGDSLYLGLEVDSLFKDARLSPADGVTDSFDWPAVYPGLLAGWTLYRGAASFVAVEASAGWVFLTDATYSRETAAGRTEGTFKGSGFGATAGLTGTWFVVPSLGLELMLGWRQANLEHIEAGLNNGGGIDTPRAGSPRVDYSGPVARLGLSINWGVNRLWTEWDEAAPQPAGPPATGPAAP